VTIAKFIFNFNYSLFLAILKNPTTTQAQTDFLVNSHKLLRNLKSLKNPIRHTTTVYSVYERGMPHLAMLLDFLFYFYLFFY